MTASTTPRRASIMRHISTVQAEVEAAPQPQATTRVAQGLGRLGAAVAVAAAAVGTAAAVATETAAAAAAVEPAMVVQAGLVVSSAPPILWFRC